MRIAIDAANICDTRGEPGAGIEHYTWNIVRSLLRVKSGHTFFVYVPEAFPRHREHELQAAGSTVRCIRRRQRFPFLSRHALFPLALRLRNIDVLFSPHGQLPWFWRGRSVITVHDLCIYEHPEWFPQESLKSFATQYIVPRSLFESVAIICVSEATAKQVTQLVPSAASRLQVIPEGVRPSSKMDVLSPARKTGEVVLYLGTLEPRKNLVNAILGFHSFLEKKPEYVKTARFLLAGSMGWKTEAITQAITRVNEAWFAKQPQGVVAYLGPVAEKEKWELLKRADVFLFPSWHEGFGLPPLEAMAAGTPVICSNRGALPEVGGDAVMYVDPSDIEGMSLAIAQCILLPEGLLELKNAAQERVRLFTWEKAAEATLRVLESVDCC